MNKATIELIANSEFDINNLPKLFREEEPRNRHTKKVTEGVHFPTDGSKPELITGGTKMQSAFKDMSTFLSAWMFYISIRVSYAPERGFGLAHWTERLVYYSQCGSNGQSSSIMLSRTSRNIRTQCPMPDSTPTANSLQTTLQLPVVPMSVIPLGLPPPLRPRSCHQYLQLPSINRSVRAGIVSLSDASTRTKMELNVPVVISVRSVKRTTTNPFNVQLNHPPDSDVVNDAHFSPCYRYRFP